MNNALVTSFWESGWFGRAILIILFFLSIYAWAIVAMKWRLLREIKSSSARFRQLFHKRGADFLALYQQGLAPGNSPFQAVYENMAEDLSALLDINIKEGRGNVLSNLQLDTLAETADCTISEQVIGLERYLVVLSSTASISPLLGLLGTVWGVLISFRGMAHLGSASLSVVAPGISEALVTTVAGLIVAIPALVSYNWITNRIRTLTRELENFSSRLLARVQAAYGASFYEKETVA